MGALADRPHCGAMLSQHEPEAIGRLVSRLRDEVDRRQRSPASDLPAPARPRLLLLIDGWENLVEALDAYEPGSIVDGLIWLLREAPSSQLTIALTAGTANLTSRVTASIQRTYRLGDTANRIAGRATKIPGELQVQFAQPDSVRPSADAEPDERPPRSARTGPIYIRPLPERIDRRELVTTAATAPTGVLLGVAGDASDPIAIDLLGGDGRWLIAGPARSGRTTLLVSMLHQLTAAQVDVLIAAPARSPLSRAAYDLGTPAFDPASTAIGPFLERDQGHRIVLVDDCAAFADQPLEARLLEFVSAGSGRIGFVVTARSDDPATGYRGIAAAVRRSGTGILLQPGPADGELLGVRLPRARSAPPVGRGVLVCDQATANALKRGRGAVPIQLAY